MGPWLPPKIDSGATSSPTRSLLLRRARDELRKNDWRFKKIQAPEK